MARPQPKPIDTKQWKKVDRDVKLEKFIVTAVIMPAAYKPGDPTKRLIHWRGGGAYYNEADEEGRSTSFDTRKLSVTDPVVEVQLISKPYMVSSVAPYYWESLLSKDCTAKDIYDLVVAYKLNHYVYNGAGSGCLTWTTRLVEVLENEGVLPAGSMRRFSAKVQEVRADPNYWVPEEPGARFY
ncbi:hypothetical protein EDD16DRAFT_1113474 [Pisolithus croceorrhizus]|nr:hypothetical protein F5141DRAFT_1067078 [Pisolithus sp. B1]KAI6106131.1 hypothetical protein EV401DRAFT_1892748 [Pisolithus croceorrhizus]KAI6114612.1 hypothetical protein EDD16DRAFT_1113474 [Pisolithus croceorrhizus]KAI6146608.1 hypothetical protein EDD17DRAFT_1651040 [Pisolithus thermaeus]